MEATDWWRQRIVAALGSYLLPRGLHHLEAWNEAVCDGALDAGVPAGVQPHPQPAAPHHAIATLRVDGSALRASWWTGEVHDGDDDHPVLARVETLEMPKGG